MDRKEGGQVRRDIQPLGGDEQRAPTYSLIKNLLVAPYARLPGPYDRNEIPAFSAIRNQECDQDFQRTFKAQSRITPRTTGKHWSNCILTEEFYQRDPQVAKDQSVQVGQVVECRQRTDEGEDDAAVIIPPPPYDAIALPLEYPTWPYDRVYTLDAAAHAVTQLQQFLSFSTYVPPDSGLRSKNLVSLPFLCYPWATGRFLCEQNLFVQRSLQVKPTPGNRDQIVWWYHMVQRSINLFVAQPKTNGRDTLRSRIFESAIDVVRGLQRSRNPNPQKIQDAQDTIRASLLDFFGFLLQLVAQLSTLQTYLKFNHNFLLSTDDAVDVVNFEDLYGERVDGVRFRTGATSFTIENNLPGRISVCPVIRLSAPFSRLETTQVDMKTQFWDLIKGRRPQEVPSFPFYSSPVSIQENGKPIKLHADIQNQFMSSATSTTPPGFSVEKWLGAIDPKFPWERQTLMRRVGLDARKFYQGTDLSMYLLDLLGTNLDRSQSAFNQYVESLMWANQNLYGDPNKSPLASSLSNLFEMMLGTSQGWLRGLSTLVEQGKRDGGSIFVKSVWQQDQTLARLERSDPRRFLEQRSDLLKEFQSSSSTAKLVDIELFAPRGSAKERDTLRVFQQLSEVDRLACRLSEPPYEDQQKRLPPRPPPVPKPQKQKPIVINGEGDRAKRGNRGADQAVIESIEELVGSQRVPGESKAEEIQKDSGLLDELEMGAVFGDLPGAAADQLAKQRRKRLADVIRKEQERHQREKEEVKRREEEDYEDYPSPEVFVAPRGQAASSDESSEGQAKRKRDELDRRVGKSYDFWYNTDFDFEAVRNPETNDWIRFQEHVNRVYSQYRLPDFDQIQAILRQPRTSANPLSSSHRRSHAPANPDSPFAETTRQTYDPSLFGGGVVPPGEQIRINRELREDQPLQAELVEEEEEEEEERPPTMKGEENVELQKSIWDRVFSSVRGDEEGDGVPLQAGLVPSEEFSELEDQRPPILPLPSEQEIRASIDEMMMMAEQKDEEERVEERKRTRRPTVAAIAADQEGREQQDLRGKIEKKRELERLVQEAKERQKRDRPLGDQQGGRAVVPKIPPSPLLTPEEKKTLLEKPLSAATQVLEKRIREEVKAVDPLYTKNRRPCDELKGTPQLTDPQAFLSEYMTIVNPLKGLILDHEVGHGKTGGAIAIASNSFEFAGFTILVVTKDSLKAVFLKDMVVNQLHLYFRDLLALDPGHKDRRRAERCIEKIKGLSLGSKSITSLLRECQSETETPGRDQGEPKGGEEDKKEKKKGAKGKDGPDEGEAAYANWCKPGKEKNIECWDLPKTGGIVTYRVFYNALQKAQLTNRAEDQGCGIANPKPPPKNLTNESSLYDSLLNRTEVYSGKAKRRKGEDEDGAGGEVGGERDWLKKVLIIIDEAHKPLEEPEGERSTNEVGVDPRFYQLLRLQAHRSYKMSGKDSCRILLLSATLMPSGPANVFTMLNVMINPYETNPEFRQECFEIDDFSEDKDKLLDEFFQDNPRFPDCAPGYDRACISKRSLNYFGAKAIGFISYLNRWQDIRYFPTIYVNPILREGTNQLGPGAVYVSEPQLKVFRQLAKKKATTVDEKTEVARKIRQFANSLDPKFNFKWDWSTNDKQEFLDNLRKSEDASLFPKLIKLIQNIQTAEEKMCIHWRDTAKQIGYSRVPEEARACNPGVPPYPGYKHMIFSEVDVGRPRGAYGSRTIATGLTAHTFELKDSKGRTYRVQFPLLDLRKAIQEKIEFTYDGDLATTLEIPESFWQKNKGKQFILLFSRTLFEQPVGRESGGEGAPQQRKRKPGVPPAKGRKAPKPRKVAKKQQRQQRQPRTSGFFHAEQQTPPWAIKEEEEEDPLTISVLAPSNAPAKKGKKRPKGGRRPGGRRPGGRRPGGRRPGGRRPGGRRPGGRRPGGRRPKARKAADVPKANKAKAVAKPNKRRDLEFQRQVDLLKATSRDRGNDKQEHPAQPVSRRAPGDKRKRLAPRNVRRGGGAGGKGERTGERYSLGQPGRIIRDIEQKVDTLMRNKMIDFESSTRTKAQKRPKGKAKAPAGAEQTLKQKREDLAEKVKFLYELHEREPERVSLDEIRRATTVRHFPFEKSGISADQWKSAREAALRAWNDKSNDFGEHIKFIVLDSESREGISLLNTKYAHLFEPSALKTGFVQALGRIVRFCGTGSLKWYPEKGTSVYITPYQVLFRQPEEGFMIRALSPDGKTVQEKIAESPFDLYQAKQADAERSKKDKGRRDDVLQEKRTSKMSVLCMVVSIDRILYRCSLPLIDICNPEMKEFNWVCQDHRNPKNCKGSDKVEPVEYPWGKPRPKFQQEAQRLLGQGEEGTALDAYLEEKYGKRKQKAIPSVEQLPNYSPQALQEADEVIREVEKSEGRTFDPEERYRYRVAILEEFARQGVKV